MPPLNATQTFLGLDNPGELSPLELLGAMVSTTAALTRRAAAVIFCSGSLALKLPEVHQPLKATVYQFIGLQASQRLQMPYH